MEQENNKMNNFRNELEILINKYSLENGSNTPDFILAHFLTDCLKAFDGASEAKRKYYGQAQEGTIYHELHKKFMEHIPESLKLNECGTNDNNLEKIVITTGIPAGCGFTGQSHSVFVEKMTTNIAPIESTDIPEITMIKKIPDVICHESTNEICQTCPEIINCTECFPNIENCQVKKFEELNKIENSFEKDSICKFCKNNPCICEDDLPF